MSLLGDELQNFWNLNPTGYCYCGCGAETRSHVAPGHDPRVAPNLLAQLRGDKNVAHALKQMSKRPDKP